MVKACLHHDIHECVLIEGFYFRLSQQSTDTLFVGGMLRSSYNQIKATLNSMTNNSQEWDDVDYMILVDPGSYRKTYFFAYT